MVPNSMCLLIVEYHQMMISTSSMVTKRKRNEIDFSFRMKFTSGSSSSLSIAYFSSVGIVFDESPY
jgi:hypothetical protein